MGTWSGRLIVLNSLVMLAIVVLDQSLFIPSMEVLDAVGAKDPVALAQGQYWRFLSPIFVHIGLIHFAFNTMGLFYIGYQLERVLGPWWFLGVYLLAGVSGNIASSVFNVAMSAGASGALFGLLGSGFYLEKTIGERIEALTGRRPRQSVYSGMILINVILGFVVPGIDNAAHLGGLAAGFAVTYLMAHLRPNRLIARSPGRAAFVGGLMLVLLVGGAFVGTNPRYITKKITEAGDHETNISRQHYLYSEAIKVAPLDADLRIKRGRIRVLHGNEKEGLADLRVAAASPSSHQAIRRLAAEVAAEGYFDVAKEIESILVDGPDIKL